MKIWNFVSSLMFLGLRFVFFLLSLSSFLSFSFGSSKRSFKSFSMRHSVPVSFSFDSYLPLLRKAKNPSQLEFLLKRMEEEGVIKRACEIEEEREKMPKACFNYSRIPSLSRKKALEIERKANHLCQKRVKNTESLFVLENWMKISSLSAKCLSFLEEKARLLRYRQKEDFE